MERTRVMPTRSASAKWEGGLKGGRGIVQRRKPGLGGQYNFSARGSSTATGSNPEELLAAAEAACYSMALSGGAREERHAARRASRPRPSARSRRSARRSRSPRCSSTCAPAVPKIDDATFQRIAAETKDGLSGFARAQGQRRHSVDGNARPVNVSRARSSRQRSLAACRAGTVRAASKRPDRSSWSKSTSRRWCRRA